MPLRRQRAVALLLVAAGAGTFGAASTGLAGTDAQLRAITEPPADVRLVDCPFERERPVPEV